MKREVARSSVSPRRVRDKIGGYYPLSWYSGVGVFFDKMTWFSGFPPPQPSPGVPGEGEIGYTGTVTHPAATICAQGCCANSPRDVKNRLKAIRIAPPVMMAIQPNTTLPASPITLATAPIPCVIARIMIRIASGFLMGIEAAELRQLVLQIRHLLGHIRIVLGIAFDRTHGMQHRRVIPAPKIAADFFQ